MNIIRSWDSSQHLSLPSLAPFDHLMYAGRGVNFVYSAVKETRAQFKTQVWQVLRYGHGSEISRTLGNNERQTDRPTNQQTDRPGQTEVSLLIRPLTWEEWEEFRSIKGTRAKKH